MAASLLGHFPLKPQHLAFFEGAATDLMLDGSTMKGGAPDNPDWCYYAMYWRNLSDLSIMNCARLKDNHLDALVHSPGTLRNLTFEQCPRISTAVLSKLPKTVSLRSLTFRNCGTGSVLPNCVSTFTDITHLNLSNQRLSDIDIVAISPLCQLRYLDVSGCEVSQVAVDSLVTLTNLHHLDISWTFTSYPPPLASLRTLIMDACRVGGEWDMAYAVHASVHGGPSAFSSVASISMNNSTFEESDGVQAGSALLKHLLQASSKTIRSLYLQSGMASSMLTSVLSVLPSLQGLSTLCLEDVGVVHPSALSSVQALTGLRRLCLKCASLMSNAHLVELGHLHGLTELQLFDCDHVMDEGFEGLLRGSVGSTLRSLDICSSRMHGRCDYVITAARNQQGVAVTSSNLNHEFLPDFISLAACVASWHGLFGSYFIREHAGANWFDAIAGQEDIVGWAHMPHLEHLNINALDADAVMSQACAACANLKSLAVGSGRVMSESLENAAKLKHLTSLRFSGTVPSQDIIEVLMRSQSLREVVLHCWISDPEDKMFAYATEQLRQQLRARGGDLEVVSVDSDISEQAQLGHVRLSAQQLGGIKVSGTYLDRKETIDLITETVENPLRLRYSKATLLAMRHKGSQSLKSLQLISAIPSSLAKNPW